MQMKRKIGYRLAHIFLVLLGVSFLSFLLMYVSPGDPVRAMYAVSGSIPSEEVLEQTREELGLNDPFFIQYGNWISNCLRGDFGTSYSKGEAVATLLMERVMPTIQLALLSLVMLAEALFGTAGGSAPLFQSPLLRYPAGLLAGFGIGTVAALLGVAGGELLIPTIVLLYGLDIKLAGSLSLVVSLPTMIVGFARYTGSDAFQVIRQEQSLFRFMAAGSILGAGLGGLLLGIVPTQAMMAALGIILLLSAIKTFQHSR